MATEPDKDLVDLEAEADVLLAKVREVAMEAVPVLLKLKRAQFRTYHDPKMLALILGTDDPDGMVKQSVRAILQSAVRGLI